MSKKPLVNVIIVTYNQFKFIRECINSVLNSDYSNMKIYLVDNNSNESDYRKLYDDFKKNKKISFFRLNKNKGFGAGCNYVLKLIRDGYIVFLNDDAIVTKNWLNPIISYMEDHPDVGAAQPKIKDMKRKKYFQHAGAAGGFMDVYGYPFCRGRIFYDVEEDNGQYDNVIDVVWCSGNCLVTRLEVLRKVGFFDEIFFMYAEEADLCWRMNKAGYRLVFIPSSLIYHYGMGGPSRQPYKKIFWHHRNGLIMLIKNYTLLEIIKYLPVRFILDFLTLWYYLIVNRIMSNALALVAAYLSFIYLLPKVLIRKFRDSPIKSNGLTPYPLYNGSIVFDYFLGGKKKFTDLNKIHGVQ